MLAFAGLPEPIEDRCSELRPFDQHRVSLARALVNEPVVLLLEQLDHVLAGEELRTFTALAREAAARFGVAVIATVSPAFAAEPADRVIELAGGAVRRDSELLPGPEA